MKKTLVSALTTALVVGAASTTFAAANPFSDVPANSWAYNAVATLVRDGVVNGFPNGTFQGQKTMTRYEMAQIVAKAMSYENITKADKAVVDKLAAEFHEELGNLGVRVDKLENRVDKMVKFEGKVEYTYSDTKYDKKDGTGASNELAFKLSPSAQINKNWTAHTELSYKLDPAISGDNENKVEVNKIYVQGKVGNATVLLGKYPAFLANGLVFDAKLSGAAAVLGNDKTTVTLAAGRYHTKDADMDAVKASKAKTTSYTADVYAAQVDHNLSDKVKVDAGYIAVRGLDNDKPAVKVDTRNNIWFVGADATVAKDLKLSADYAKASLADKKDDHNKSAQDKAYNVALNYKGENASQAGSYGVEVAYRNLGKHAAFEKTYDAIDAGQKGMAYKVAYVPAENVVTTVRYFQGKELATNEKVKTVWARAEFLF